MDDSSSSSASGGGNATLDELLGDCQLHTTSYFVEEFYCYLFIMCPLAVAGVVLNLISLKVFNDRSFNTVTFKYIRLITLTDCFICLIIIPYCLTAYTQPFNKYDLFARHFYLAYIYIPGANLAMNLSTLLNLLVTIERLISVGWPTHKYTLFKPSRYYLSCGVVAAIALLSNVSNVFLYKVEFCKSNLLPRDFLMQRWWVVYGYVKEVLTRILPIVLLVVANIMLVVIVRASRRRMLVSTSAGKSTSKKQAPPPTQSTKKKNGRKLAKDDPGYDSASDNSLPDSLVDVRAAGGKMPRTGAAASSAAPPVSKKSRQESQLTVMTIVVAVLYLATSIPMVFAYPGLVFKSEQTASKIYKMYAVLVNILELVQCSFRFLIYFCFTTQFRHVLGRMVGYERRRGRPAGRAKCAEAAAAASPAANANLPLLAPPE